MLIIKHSENSESYRERRKEKKTIILLHDYCTSAHKITVTFSQDFCPSECICALSGALGYASAHTCALSLSFINTNLIKIGS